MTATSPNAVTPALPKPATGQKPSGQARASHHGHFHHARAHHAATSQTASGFHGLVAQAAAPRTASAPAISDEVTQALRSAMEKEGVPTNWENGLQFIVDHESSGQVGASNKHDSARGLFQLTRASYDLNPNGARSFGNAVEEAQGGIRYIKQRYQTAENAVQFWQRHRYY